MKNLIINGRLVSDITYAVRNLRFLCSVYNDGVPCPTCSGMDEEEFEYLCSVGCELLRYQVETCPGDEKWYFKNLVKGYKDGDDIIENFICKNHPEFWRFLKVIKAV